MILIKTFLVEATDQRVTEDAVTRTLYRNTETGEVKQLSEFGVGAIWRAEWMEDCPAYCGVDGKSYYCRTPGGDWLIDSRASNCTRPTDSQHKCWCRHGEAPNFTVNKVGDTCSAGAGSIVIGDFHGFLTNGFITGC